MDKVGVGALPLNIYAAFDWKGICCSCVGKAGKINLLVLVSGLRMHSFVLSTLVDRLKSIDLHEAKEEHELSE